MRVRVWGNRVHAYNIGVLPMKKLPYYPKKLPYLTMYVLALYCKQLQKYVFVKRQNKNWYQRLDNTCNIQEERG